MKVALVHDFLTQYGGAERVLEVFHEMFPKAPVYTLVYDKEKFGDKYQDWDIRTSFIQNLPFGVKFYKWYLPLMSKAVESFDLDDYDLVLSDASAFAKGVKTKARHICYCHTPTRYLWVEMDEYLKNQSLRSLIKPYLNFVLKKWDYKAAQKPDVMIANSVTVKDRIKKHYGRDVEVVYPPVDTSFYKPTVPKEKYFLTGGRLEPYKKIHLIVETFNRLGLPLKVYGTGTEESGLKELAGHNVEFVGKVSDEELRDLYSGAQAFVFPAHEDAGVSVLESLACGTPVIGYNQGGTAEFINNEINGLLFDEQSVYMIEKAIKSFVNKNFNSHNLREGVLKYDIGEFKKKVLKICELV